MLDRRADKPRRAPVMQDILGDIRGQRTLGLVLRKEDRSNRKGRRGQ